MTLYFLLALLAASTAGAAFVYANDRKNRKAALELEMTEDTCMNMVPEVTEEVPNAPEEIKEEVTPAPKRGRTKKGQFQADVPSTPENEAWQGGKSPRQLRKLPAEYELEKMTKAAIAELALARGLSLDIKKSKRAMIDELQAFKPPRKKNT